MKNEEKMVSETFPKETSQEAEIRRYERVRRMWNAKMARANAWKREQAALKDKV